MSSVFSRTSFSVSPGFYFTVCQGFVVLLLQDFPIFFFSFHLLVWLFPPLCIDGLHISSPEFFPEPQTHIFRCYSWSHLHNLQGTLMYRCELLLTHRHTHIHSLFQLHVSFSREWSVYPAIQSRNHFQTLPSPSLTLVPPCPSLSNTIILVQATLCVLNGTILRAAQMVSLL